LLAPARRAPAHTERAQRLGRFCRLVTAEHRKLARVPLSYVSERSVELSIGVGAGGAVGLWDRMLSRLCLRTQLLLLLPMRLLKIA